LLNEPLGPVSVVILALGLSIKPRSHSLSKPAKHFRQECPILPTVEFQSPCRSETSKEKKTYGAVEEAKVLVKVIIDEINFNPSFFQEIKTIIIVNIIFWIYAVNGHRMLIHAHFPHNWRNMIYVVKGSNEKQIHSSIPLFTYIPARFRQNQLNFTKNLGYITLFPEN
jgi:hypothetical protein